MFVLKKPNSILIKKIPVENKTAGGIYLPSDNTFEVLHGQLISVGPDVTGYFVNDRIIYKKVACTLKVDIEGEEYHVLDCDDIIAVSGKVEKVEKDVIIPLTTGASQ